MDAEGTVYGVKPAQPGGADWPNHVKHVYEKLSRLRNELNRKAKENLHHSRGAFDRFTCGTSHGGGRVVRRACVLRCSEAFTDVLPSGRRQ